MIARQLWLLAAVIRWAAGIAVVAVVLRWVIEVAGLTAMPLIDPSRMLTLARDAIVACASSLGILATIVLLLRKMARRTDPSLDDIPDDATLLEVFGADRQWERWLTLWVTAVVRWCRPSAPDIRSID